LFNANTIFAANGLALTYTFEVLQEVRRHVSFKVLQATSKADTCLKKERKRKKKKKETCHWSQTLTRLVGFQLT
jgi:translation initiation factor 2 gamma subunit (eIF-2gamma)